MQARVAGLALTKKINDGIRSGTKLVGRYASFYLDIFPRLRRTHTHGRAQNPRSRFGARPAWRGAHELHRLVEWKWLAMLVHLGLAGGCRDGVGHGAGQLALLFEPGPPLS